LAGHSGTQTLPGSHRSGRRRQPPPLPFEHHVTRARPGGPVLRAVDPFAPGLGPQPHPRGSRLGYRRRSTAGAARRGRDCFSGLEPPVALAPRGYVMDALSCEGSGSTCSAPDTRRRAPGKAETGALLAPTPLGREIFGVPESAAHLGSPVDASIVGRSPLAPPSRVRPRSDRGLRGWAK
jgi:hypothetical protein